MRPSESPAIVIADKAPPLALETRFVEQSMTLKGAPLRRAMGFITVSWVFGSVWLTATSGVPYSLFARHLKATEFQIGLLAALPFVASLISMPASLLTERTGARKKIFLWGQYAQRAMWLPIALVPLWVVTHYGAASTGTAMMLFLGLIFIMHCLGAVGGPPWLSWMADVVPERVRGKYFSRRRQWGILSAIPTAICVGWLLDRVGTHDAGHSMQILRWCGLIFLSAAVFGIVDIHLFQYVPEIPMEPRKHVPVFNMLCKPLKDRQFLWFAGFVATLTFAVSFMGQFVTFYLIDKVGVTGTGIQLMLLVAPMIAQLVMLPVWGQAVDRMGKKPVMAIASLGLVPVGLGWCLMGGGGPNAIWLGYALSVGGAALWTGVEVANLNFVLEFSGSKDADSDEPNCGSSYVAMNSVIINIAGCLGGLSSGILARVLRDWHWDPAILGLPSMSFYEVLFAVSGVLRLLAAVVFLPYLHETRSSGARETLRFISSNIYNNMYNAVLLPLRYLRLPTAQSFKLNADQSRQRKAA